MVQNIIRFFTSPFFDDEDKTRVAGLLNIISIVIFVCLLLVCIVSPFLFQEPIIGIIIAIITAFPILSVWILVRNGYVRLASQLFVFSFYLLDTALIIITGGVHSGVLPGYVAVAVLAGLLLGRRSTIALIVVIALTTLGMVLAGYNDTLPTPVIYIDDLARWLSLMMNIALAATLLDLATTGINKALARARRGEAALAETNIELKKEISERKRTEYELRQLKEFNENIVLSMAETIIIEDENGYLTFANPRIEKLLGYSPDELIGKHYTATVPNEQVELITSETTKRPDGIESQYEVSLLRKDGTEIPVIASARPLFNEGVFVGVITTFTDITDRKLVEKELLDTHQQLNTTLNALPDLLFEINADGHILNYHAPVTDMLYTQPEDFLGKSIREVLPNDPAEMIMYAIKGTVDTGRHIGTTYSLETPMGTRWFELSMASKNNPNGDGTTVVALVRDITERKFAEEAMKESEEKYRSLVENVNVGVYRNSGIVDGLFIHANSAIVRMFGYENLDEFMGVSFVDFYETSVERERFVNEVIEQGTVKNRELRLRKKDGTPFWASCTSTAQFDEDGNLKWIDGVIEDITIRKKAEEQLLHDALHDTLTNLPNRALFYDRLSNTMARALRREDYSHAVLFLDLDRFKLVNDSLGHTIGDNLLIMVADRLSSFLRSADTIARLGGDEFVILVEDIDGVSEATEIADRVQEELKKPFNIRNHEVYTSASIGIVYNFNGYKSPEDILRDADTAMYRAKRLGKERYELFDLTMRQDVIQRMQVETELRQGFERGEFQVYYQPQVSLESDKIVGFEALLRWEHPERGLILPAEFINIAEETGIIIPLGHQVFQECKRVIAQLNMEFSPNPPFYVSINLSRRQFSDPDLIPAIKTFLDSSGVNSSSLILEITEGVIMENSDKAAEMIKQLRELGVKIQMDDFGTGYSSLATLHHFPIAALKIAREFIIDVDTNEDRSEVVRTIITLARIMGIQVVAEGVETSGQLKYLKDEKCDIWQGNYFSEPLSFESLKTLISEKNVI